MATKRTIGFFAFLALAALGADGGAEAATLIVGGANADFSSIQAAVDAAPEGATIVVKKGVYREQVQIGKKLALEAETGVVVDAGRKGSAITLSGSGISLTGFEVRNAGSADTQAGLLIVGDGNTVSRIKATGNNSGVVVLGARGNTISDCDISGNKHDGLMLIGATATIVTRNTFADNGRAGVWIEARHLANSVVEATENRILANKAHGNVSFGIALNTGANRNEVADNEVASNGHVAAEAGILINCGPNGNLVQRNALANNLKHGILLITGSFSNRILANEISGSSTGIGVYASNANEFAENRVSGSTEFGIHLDDDDPMMGSAAKLPGFAGGMSPVSSQNLLHHNDLSANRVNAFDRSGKPWKIPGAAALSAEVLAAMREALGPNKWDDGSEGNHYDDFDEAREGFADRNGDGIGEVTHPIPGGVAVDHFPLAEPQFPKGEATALLRRQVSQPSNENPGVGPGLCSLIDACGLLVAAHQALVAVLEARDAAAAVDDVLAAAGPGGMRLRVDVEVEHRARLAVGRAGRVLGAVGHHDLDLVIVRVDVFLHGDKPRDMGRPHARGRLRGRGITSTFQRGNLKLPGCTSCGASTGCPRLRARRLMGGLDFRLPCGRCQLYRWSQIGSSCGAAI